MLLTLFRVELAETNRHITSLASAVKDVEKQVKENAGRIEVMEEVVGVKRERN